jgi:uncharacterized membrane protein YgdD (TMEM256/DUF423 family)
VRGEDRACTAAGALSAALAVVCGAFGAHALRGQLPAERLLIWHTAVEYQMYAALGLLAVGAAAARQAGRAVSWAGWLLLAGTVLFSGSLYALALSGVRVLGAITPFGGLCFIAGWVCLAAAALRER